MEGVGGVILDQYLHLVGGVVEALVSVFHILAKCPRRKDNHHLEQNLSITFVVSFEIWTFAGARLLLHRYFSPLHH